MKLCARCKKRPAVVFITRLENGESINEGICLNCAKELGLKPVEDIMEKMGITDEDLDRMNEEVETLMQTEDGETEGTDEEQGKTPPIDFRKLFGGLIRDNGNGKNAAAQNPGGETASGSSGKDKKKKENNRKFLPIYCRDLTARAAEGTLDRVIGREKELMRMEQILCRRQKNNPCLIGEPGVGKTAIAEALASAIVAGNVPYALKNKEVHLLDLTALVAGTQFRGQFESRIKGLIEEVRSLGNIILVIDEVHSIVAAGDAEGGMNAANIMKPALSRGEIQVIGATTLTEYRKYIEKDAALERRFQPITVEEPSVEETIQILLGIKGYYEQFHGIRIPDETVRRIVALSERYITDRFLPDKSIDLMDEAAAHLVLRSPEIGELAETTAKLAAVSAAKKELEAASTKGLTEDEMQERYKQLADYQSKELVLAGEKETLEARCSHIFLGTDEIADVIEVWTGIPAGSITELEFERIDHLGSRLKERIVGQDEAIDAIARAIKRSRAGISYKRKPVSFIFAGPTGVGKTELVKTLAADLFHTPELLIRLDMSEYMEKFAVSRIIGSPPGYVGYDDAGQLTEKIRRKPYSVVLFDEIEKAHPDVLNILLQILDDGRITDAQGRTVNFENTVIVMTTNAGSHLASNTAGFTETGKEQRENRTMRALEQFLRPEFLNRVDEIITFRALSAADFSAIATIMLGDLQKVMGERGVTLRFTAAAAEYVAKQSYDEKFGARNMRRYIQRNVEDVIAERIIGAYEANITAVSIDYSEGEDQLRIETI